MKLIILLAVIIGICDLGNGYSKYGRTCKDIGCVHNEECVMKEEPCSRTARQRNCGTYPACQLVSTQPQTCATFVCPPTQECQIKNGLPRCVAQVSSGSKRNTRQAYNPNYSSGGVTNYPNSNYNPGTNHNPNQQPNYNPNQQPNYNPNQQPNYNPNQQPNYNPNYNQNHLNYNNSRPGIYPNLGPVNPLQYPGQHPGQNPGQTLPINPLQYPGQHPGQNPGNTHPVNPLQYPGQYPGQNPNTGHNTGNIGGHPTYPNPGNANTGNDFYVSQTQGSHPNTGNHPNTGTYPNTGTNQGIHGQTYPIQPGYQGGNYNHRTNY